MQMVTLKKNLLCVVLSFVLVVGMAPFAYANEKDIQPDQAQITADQDLTVDESDADAKSEAAFTNPDTDTKNETTSPDPDIEGQKGQTEKDSTLSDNTTEDESQAESLKKSLEKDLDEKATTSPQDENPKTDQEKADQAENSEIKISSVEDARAGVDYVEDEVIVVFKAEKSNEEAEKVIKRNNSVEVLAPSEEASPVDELAVVEIAEGSTVSEAVEELSKDPEVAYAQANYLYNISEEGEADADFSTQAAVTINDPRKNDQWALKATNIYNAWSLAKTEKKVGVAVIDTGVNINHPDLKNNIPAGSYFDATLTGKTGDLHGHGTHVAGIVAAQTNNGIGVSGSSYNANIIPIRIDSNSSPSKQPIMSTSSIVNAYSYLFRSVGGGQTIAQKYNVKVANLSVGGILSAPDYALENAIKNARSKGVLTVAASGNVNAAEPQGSIIHPAAYDACLSVGNLTQKGTGTEISQGSMANRYVDIAAPGSGIYSTLNNGSYGRMSGTSMASPFVAGVAALLFAANPHATPESVKYTLESTAIDKGVPGRDDKYGHGQINPYEALKKNAQVSGGVSLNYSTHVQNYGWLGSSPSNTLAQNGQMSGTSGKSLRVEALKINLTNNTMYSGGISYKTQIQNVGWQEPRSSGGESGTSGRSLRLETLSIELTGQLQDHYNIYYRVHAQNIGWMGWAKNGEDAAGTVGLSLRLEAIQIYLAPKTASPPGDTFNGISTVSPNYPCAVDTSAKGLQGDVSYNNMVHIQNIGNKTSNGVNGSTMLGTSGKSLRLEAFKMSLVNAPTSGSIDYEVHVQNIGNQGLRSQNALAGTEGRSLRLEALRVKLSGNMEQQYDIYYRTHVQNIGWTGWAKNGQWSGSAGYAYRMEAMQIVIVEKGTTAPGLNQSFYYRK